MIGLVCDGGAHDARFFCVDVRREGALRRLTARRAAAALARAGVRAAVFPREYPDADLFARRGIAPVPVRPLRSETAAEIVLAALDTLGIPAGEAKVLFAAERVNGEMCDTVLAVSERVRYIALDAANGGEALACRLRQIRGAAVCGAEGAVLRVAFDETAAASEGTLPLYDPALRISYTLAGEPAEEQMLAALRRMEAVPRSQIAVTGVSLSGLKSRALQKSIPSSSR